LDGVFGGALADPTTHMSSCCSTASHRWERAAEKLCLTHERTDQRSHIRYKFAKFWLRTLRLIACYLVDLLSGAHHQPDYSRG
jgi:hypothetical protein